MGKDSHVFKSLLLHENIYKRELKNLYEEVLKITF